MKHVVRKKCEDQILDKSHDRPKNGVFVRIWTIRKIETLRLAFPWSSTRYTGKIWLSWNVSIFHVDFLLYLTRIVLRKKIHKSKKSKNPKNPKIRKFQEKFSNNLRKQFDKYKVLFHKHDYFRQFFEYITYIKFLNNRQFSRFCFKILKLKGNNFTDIVWDWDDIYTKMVFYRY